MKKYVLCIFFIPCVGSIFSMDYYDVVRNKSITVIKNVTVEEEKSIEDKVSDKKERMGKKLNWACSEKYPDVERIKFLLDATYSLWSRGGTSFMPFNPTLLVEDELYYTPRFNAIKNGNVAAVKAFGEHGCGREIPLYTRDNLNDLHVACKYNHVEIVKYLLDKKKSFKSVYVNEQRDEWQRTPLHLAVWVGSVEIVKLLLEHGANPWFRDAFGKTPVERAEEWKKGDEIETELWSWMAFFDANKEAWDASLSGRSIEYMPEYKKNTTENF